MYDPVQYFDEMNILKDDKLRRINTAKEFINALVDFFAAQFMNLLSGIFLYEKSSSDYENELMDLYKQNGYEAVDRLYWKKIGYKKIYYFILAKAPRDLKKKIRLLVKK